LSNLVVPIGKPKLTLSDFDHMQADTDLATLWLQGSMGASAREEPAGHLLVSGRPGLGKTQWVRAILSKYASAAHEMVVLDEMGKALSGHDRLNHLRIAMVMLERRHGAVILFDEADDVFNSESESEFGSGSGNASSSEDSFGVSMVSHRASLNRLIEESQIPVVWIMNRPEVLDPAVLRRFDAVIAFEAIPRSARRRMIEGQFSIARSTSLGQDGCLFNAVPLTPAELDKWAAIDALTPALLDRLAVVKKRAAQMDVAMDVQHCDHWLSRRLPGKATKHLRSKGADHAFQNDWNAAFVNASEDLNALIEGIRRTGSARVLLYGPPGTGKTAYAHALARQIDRPLLEHRASTLLSPYVGETEERISQAFDVALQDNAVLFLDEVDSLLASRDMAARTWEVSQVNELLEQLGDYEGVVVLATNRLDALDQAVLRRMDAKILFSAMKPEQVQLAYAALCQSEGVEVTAQDLQRAASVENLTPGDFACVARKIKFARVAATNQKPLVWVLLEMLKEEVRFKSQGRRSIGFHTGGVQP
jgi:SpoVK/Ycf46/Vps4 family AAA+-type ATPase